MTAYLFFIAIIVFLLFLDYFTKRQGYGIFTIIALLVIIFFSTIRHETGYDYLQYVGMMKGSASILIDANMEWGFVGLVSLLQLFGADYFWLFFVIGTASILYFFRGSQLYTLNVRIALLIYLLVPGLFLNSFSIIRQGLAIVIMFNAYYYLFEKRYFCFWLWSVWGIMFHYSALFALPFFWLATKLSGRARLIMILGIPLSLVLAQMNVIGFVFGILLGNSKFSAYLEYKDAGSSIVKLLVLNLSVLPYLCFYDRMDKINRSFLVLAVWGLILTNIFSSVAAVTRISYYFRIFEIILLANIASYFKKGGSQMIFCTLLFIYFFIMFYSSLLFDYTSVEEYPKLTPYQTIFEK